MDNDSKLKLFKLIGFSDSKAEETLKNKAISTQLAELILSVNLSKSLFLIIYLKHLFKTGSKVFE